MQINGINLQDLTPEELAHMLADGNPKLVSSWASQRSMFHIPRYFKRKSVRGNQSNCHIV